MAKMVLKHTPPDYGRPLLHPIVRGYDFWALFDMMTEEGSGFVNNRALLVQAYREGTLYGLKVAETEEMFSRQARRDPLFVPLRHNATWYMLPCLCWCTGKSSNRTAVILWVHNSVRRHGIGSTLVRLLRVVEVDTPLEESMPFWEAIGYQADGQEKGLKKAGKLLGRPTPQSAINLAACHS